MLEPAVEVTGLEHVEGAQTQACRSGAEAGCPAGPAACPRAGGRPPPRGRPPGATSGTRPRVVQHREAAPGPPVRKSPGSAPWPSMPASALGSAPPSGFHHGRHHAARSRGVWRPGGASRWLALSEWAERPQPRGTVWSSTFAAAWEKELLDGSPGPAPPAAPQRRCRPPTSCLRAGRVPVP